MSSLEPKPVPSPCVGICRIDPFEAVCIGCFRTIEEIAEWPDMSDEEKRALAAKCEGRKQGAPGATRFRIPPLKIRRLP